MSAIGGYFELENNGDHCYHDKAIALNTGRNALEYILFTNNYRKLYIPYYTCSVLLQPLRKLGILYEYYSIDGDFEPVFNYSVIQEGEAFLYTNYYGLKDDFVKQLSTNVLSLIIDNAQAFFSLPQGTYSAFYSARKFFGVSDGAYAYTTCKNVSEIPLDTSAQRFKHLLIRAEQNAEAGYADFLANDKSLDNNPVKRMSVLTERLLSVIPYSLHTEIRRRNYIYLYEGLRNINGIDQPLPISSVPMVFPFLTKNGSNLRKQLIAKQIYVAQYWPEVLNLCGNTTYEHIFTTNLIPLPIDQRLSIHHLDIIIKTIRNAY